MALCTELYLNPMAGAMPCDIKMVATSDRKKLEEFLIETDMYLTMNEDTYNNDNRQIIFTLSFMKDGTAGP